MKNKPFTVIIRKDGLKAGDTYTVKIKKPLKIEIIREKITYSATHPSTYNPPTS